ncbi:MAG: ABC transporter substrate-binding protein [Acetobacteraceae bacterium]
MNKVILSASGTDGALRLTRRGLIAGGAALPFLARQTRAATTPGRLVFGLSSYPPSLAPWTNSGTAAATARLMHHRGLLGYGPDGAVRGELAEKWERAADGAWVFHLRDAYFHNGKKVTAEDVAWCIEQIAAPKSTAYLRVQMQDIAKIEIPDPKTIRLHTKAPSVTLPLQFASFYAPIISKDSLADSPHGIGAGPFKLTGEERGVGLDFVAFDKFYRPGLPKLKTLRLTAYADENLRVAALQAGDVDLIEYVPWQAMTGIEADGKLSMQSTPGPFMYLTFNGRVKPFGDARVRQAIAHAVKREDVIKAAFFGRGTPINGLPIPAGTEFYDKKYADGLAYDPAKAKALLAEAGLANGFSCKLLSTAQYGMHKDTAAVVQQHLAAVGIQVELVLPDWATRVALGNRGQFEMSVMGSTAESNDPDGLTPFVSGRLSPSYVRSPGLDIPKIDELLAAGRSEFDTAKRHVIYDDLQKVCLEQVPIAALCFRAQAYAMQKQVQGFTNMPGALTFYSGTTIETTST